MQLASLAPQASPQAPRERLLRLPDVETTTGLKKSTIYMLMKRGEFPRCVQVTARCVAWQESRVLQFVQDRVAATQRQQPDLLQPGATT